MVFAIVHILGDGVFGLDYGAVHIGRYRSFDCLCSSGRTNHIPHAQDSSCSCVMDRQTGRDLEWDVAGGKDVILWHGFWRFVDARGVQ